MAVRGTAACLPACVFVVRSGAEACVTKHLKIFWLINCEHDRPPDVLFVFMFVIFCA